MRLKQGEALYRTHVGCQGDKAATIDSLGPRITKTSKPTVLFKVVTMILPYFANLKRTAKVPA